MIKNKTNKHDIDAVVLWVDGNDKSHIEKMQPFVDNINDLKTDSFKSRFEHVNEIQFTIDSILKFASYVRNIYIVTDNQKPLFLKKSKTNKYNNVHIIDHTLIFKGYEDYLPTFNSLSIESCIFRIPNLSEHFIYFNDDVFLINDTKPENFFVGGLPLIRGEWTKFDENKLHKRIKKPRKGHRNAQQFTAKIVGISKYFRFRHTPHPVRKSTFQSFYKAHNDLFIKNISYKFRNPNQYIPQGLANHLEIKKKSCYFDSDYRLLYFRSYRKPFYWYKFKLHFRGKNALFMCAQSLNQSPKYILTYILNWLNQRINSNPSKSA